MVVIPYSRAQGNPANSSDTVYFSGKIPDEQPLSATSNTLQSSINGETPAATSKVIMQASELEVGGEEVWKLI